MAQALEDRIRERAYHIWERNGRADGRDQQYWIQAEREILAELAAATIITSAPTATKTAGAKGRKKAARLTAKAKKAAEKRKAGPTGATVPVTAIKPAVAPAQPAAPTEKIRLRAAR